MQFPQIPEIKLPEIKLPEIKMPEIKLPEMPQFDHTKVTNAVRDGLYIVVGAGVLGAQQAAELAKRSAEKAQELKSAAEQAARQARGLVKSAA